MRNSRARSDAILEVALDCVVLMDEAGPSLSSIRRRADVRLHRCEAVAAALAARRAAEHRESHRGHAPLPRDLCGYGEPSHELIACARAKLFPVEVAFADLCGRADVRRLHARHHRAPECGRDAGKRAEELAQLVDELHHAGRPGGHPRESDFLASMSHELRTPLNAIILYSELLQEEAADRGRGAVDFRPAAHPVGGTSSPRSDQRHPRPLENQAGKMAVSLDDSTYAPPSTNCSTRCIRSSKNDNRLTVTFGGGSAQSRPQDQANPPQPASNAPSSRATAPSLTVEECAFDGAGAHLRLTDTGVGMTRDQASRFSIRSRRPT